MKVMGSKAIHYDSGPNMTPLVDIVMVILIFLMLTGSFEGIQHYLSSNLPISRQGVGGTPLPAGFVPDEPLSVLVWPDDANAAVYHVKVGGHEEIAVNTADQNQSRQQLEKMRSLLQGIRQQMVEVAKTPIDRIQVQISPTRQVRWQYLINIYEAAADSGFTKIGYTTARQ